jgi:hypothetical protein
VSRPRKPAARAVLPPEINREAVFLNCPYDRQFTHLYLAYIAGICSFGMVPRATLEIGGGERRLTRIIQLIRTCPYSFHDLSRVELDAHRPATPRLNMAFELGLTVMSAALGPQSHTWCVFESRNRRLDKSLSDLGGTDVYVHDGSVRGVFREIGNALVRPNKPSVPEMTRVYKALEKALPQILRNFGARTPFEARAFSELVWSAQDAVKRGGRA